MNKVEFFLKLTSIPLNSTDPVHSHRIFADASSSNVNFLEVSAPVGPTTSSVDVPAAMTYLVLFNNSPSDDPDYRVQYYVGDSDGNHREMWLDVYGLAILPNVTPHTTGKILFSSSAKVSNVHVLVVE